MGVFFAHARARARETNDGEYQPCENCSHPGAIPAWFPIIDQECAGWTPRASHRGGI